MIALIAMLLVAEQVATAAPTPLPTNVQCEYDPKILELGFDAFDQDVTAGWRALSLKPGCEEAAANMVRAFRMNAEASLPLLYWHEAQLRAVADDYTAAVPLMEKSRVPADRDKFGWNAYVDATIGFLRSDQTVLMKAREQLVALPRPSSVGAKRSWPPNLSVIDGLIRCIGKIYKIAYGPSCRKSDALIGPTHVGAPSRRPPNGS